MGKEPEMRPGWKLNSDVEHVERIMRGIDACKGHCPCIPRHLHVGEDTLCPCKNMREKNVCECNLYITEGLAHE